MFSYYNNESLRKLVVGFGNIFNDMYVGKYNKDGNLTKKDRVPLTYGPKEKFIRRIKEVSTISDVTRSRITLPRMGFEMLGMSYDPTRKANKLRRTSGAVSGGEAKTSFSAVPYLVNFGLYTFTRNIDENLQLVEQILPYFSPEFIISVNFNDVDKKVNIPIVLTSTGISEIYEGDFSETRSITTTFSFIAKTYVYGKIAPAPVVTEAELRLFESDFDSGPDSNKPGPTVRPTQSLGIRQFTDSNENPVNIFSTQTEGPFAVSGYYPLYSNAPDAVKASPFPKLIRDGETTVGYHTHLLGGVLYYMPNGLIMNKTMFHGNYVDTNPDDPGPDIIDEENQEDLPLVRLGAAGGNRPRRPEDLISGSIKTLQVITQPRYLGIIEQGDLTEAEWADDFLFNSDKRIAEGIENYLKETDRSGDVRSTYLNENTTGYVLLDIEHPMNLGLVRYYNSPERKESSEKFAKGIILRINAWREIMPNAKFGVWRFGGGLSQDDYTIITNSALIPNHYANQIALSQVEFQGKSLFESVDFLSPSLFQELDRDDSVEGSKYDDDDGRIFAGARTDSIKQTCDGIREANGDINNTMPVIALMTRGLVPGYLETSFNVYNGPWAGEKNATEMYYLKDFANHFIIWYPENSSPENQTLEQFDEVPSTRQPIQPDEVGLTDEERLLLEVEKIHIRVTDGGTVSPVPGGTDDEILPEPGAPETGGTDDDSGSDPPPPPGPESSYPGY